MNANGNGTRSDENHGGDANVAAVAALFGDPARARILLALAASHELPASVLAAEAGLSAPATSAHLRKLLSGGLIAVTRLGRYRYYRIASQDVAEALETLARLAPAHPIQSLRQSQRARALRFARICYDHLAGELAVVISDAFIAHRAVTTVPPSTPDTDEEHWTLGPAAPRVFGQLGIRIAPAALASATPSPLRTCHDWSARRPHLAGTLGRTLLTTMLRRTWLTRIPQQRAVSLTPTGACALAGILDLDLADQFTRDGQQRVSRP
ncbi:ArsR/SmtB family transcription factor [Goodfellowiella coeruleoviolacea]|uniref:ArsR/SmtB family transcription factor n=1 Tax=Goodfellowiella coeruleoviolacea TaxID=334858 RepID=UPI0020A53537|nr:helix-turn-helix transcriptional regulator [Goodfellowiella coeruleoviolacea]